MNALTSAFAELALSPYSLSSLGRDREGYWDRQPTIGLLVGIGAPPEIAPNASQEC